MNIDKLKHSQIILQVSLDKELKAAKPITLSEFCKKLSRKTNLQLKLISEDMLLEKLGVYIFDVLVEEEKLQLSVRLKEKPLKGKAKIIGLKSTILKEDEIILTSFGEKNNTILEHKIINEQDEQLVDNPSYDVSNITKSSIELKNSKIAASIDNPLNSKTNKKLDYLEKKDDLELMYFGKLFNDNLHIQLIYNILDIKKILSLYIEDINYIVCNLGRPKNPEDLMGLIPYHIPFNDFIDSYKYKFNEFYDRSKNYFIYLNNVISNNFYKKSQNDDDENVKKIEVYNILRILSLCRQFVKHGNPDKINLFDLSTNPKINDIVNIIRNNYNDDIKKLNNSFVKSSEKNVYLIMYALNYNIHDSKKVKEILNEYYDFTMGKQNKNLGFDFIVIRELLIEKIGLLLNEDDKSRYYQIFNFIIYKKLLENKDLINDVVLKLRQAESQENKTQIYLDFVSKLYPIFKSILTNKLVMEIDSNKTRNTSNVKYFKDINLNSLLRSNIISTDFDKLIYYLCAFLEPKEINMLVTSLINKFENIKGFIQTINNVYGTTNLEFVDEYKMFSLESTNNIIESLKVVLTLSRMNKDNNKKAKKSSKGEKVYNTAMYYDAYYLFGALDNNIEKLHNDVFAIKGKKGAPKKTFKNFVLSSIINSNKFRLIVKYANPKECYKIMQNDVILRYVLGNMPDSQLDKYCNDIQCYSKKRNEKINNLIVNLKKIDIYYLKNNYDKETIKISTLTGLYMAVLFILIKQLVRINSYYSIAISVLERDNSLYGITKEDKQFDLELVKLFINKNKMKPRTCNYLLSNIDKYEEIFNKRNKNKEIKGNLIGANYRSLVRNKIQHLNVIANLDEYIEYYNGTNGKMHSYFELYHFILQMSFMNTYESNYDMSNELNLYKQIIKNSGTYSKDLLHIITMPFAYNLARYKNLSIEDIFNDQYDSDVKIK